MCLISATNVWAEPPHVVVVGGDAEYGSRTTTEKIAARLRDEFGFKTTLIHSHVGALEGNRNPDKSIPGLEVIEDADLLIIYVRMRVPPQEQLDLLHAYFESGKPAIGMRTTTHGFTNDRGWCPRYFGGHYWSHFGDGIELFTLPDQDEHPILRGVPRHATQTANGVYLTNPLGPSATPLVLAKRSDDTPAETYAWINEYKPGSRQFFFTAGHPEEFDETHNEALLYNAVHWCLDKEIPAGGVLKNASITRASVPVAQPSAPPAMHAPKDGIVLFDGKDLSRWDWWFGGKEPRVFELDDRAHSGAGLPEFDGAQWDVEVGAAVAAIGRGDIVTRDEFTDYELHLDFLVPASPEGVQPLWRGNSGVYLNGRYEIQILDSNNDSEGDLFSCGAIAGQRAPDEQAGKRAGTWQTLDIIFRAPRYRYGRQRTPARATVVLNGRIIHDNVAISQPATWGFRTSTSDGPLAGPIRLESDTAPVRFANVWVRPLDAKEVSERLPDEIELTGQPWIDMDYGPYLTASIEVSPGNIAQKGVAIRVDRGEGGASQGSEFLLFDTDTLRFAAGWVGNLIDWRGIAFNGQHEIHPALTGHLVFSNPEGPGWAEPGTGSFADTRIQGRDGKHYGPLDRDWARWHGLYRHGQQVILSYSVGEAEILETPGAAQAEMPLLTRSFNIGPRNQELVLQVAHDPENDFVMQGPKGRQLVSFASPKGGRGPAEDEDDEDFEEEEEFDDEEEAEEEDIAEENEEADDDDDGDEARDAEGWDLSGEGILIGKSDDFEMMDSSYTIFARIRTEEDGSIFAKSPREGEWAENGKTLFIADGRLAFDIGWVGAAESDADIADGEWHDVAVTFDHEQGTVRLFVDGAEDAQANIAPADAVEDHVIRIGFTSPDFPDTGPAFDGSMANVGFYQRALTEKEIAALAKGTVSEDGLIAWWKTFEHDADKLVDATQRGHDGELEDVEVWDVGEGDDDDEDDDEGGSSGAGIWNNAPYSVCGLVGGRADLAWKTTDNGDLQLVIPAGAEPIRFTLCYAKADDPEELADLREVMAALPETPDLEPLCQGGAPLWGDTITTSVTPHGETDGPFVIETLTLPDQNPYRSWLRLGGFDFFPDGNRAAICTWQGDVWLVEGLKDNGGNLSWRRIAAGMFQPLGLKIVDNDVYVTCRDQITRLRDLNGDQEVDFYENFNNDAQVTEHFHEFAVGLQTDEEGNFYYCKCARHARDAVVPQHGTLLKVSRDGATTEIVANGFRAPNGLCVNADGTFIVSDQEGHWTPKNRINLVRPGGFYGNLMGYHDDRTLDDTSPPITWIHNDFDRSPAEQVRVTSSAWGPLKGQLLNLSYGTGRVHLLLEQQLENTVQGGLVALPMSDMPTGIMRGRFHPADGQLYACGLFGWSSNKTDPGGFYRIRCTDEPLNLPLSLEVNGRQLILKFSDALDPESATNPRNYSFSEWNYRATSDYGSEDYRISNERRRGRDRLRVQKATLSDDGTTLTLDIPKLQPAMQLELKYRIRTAAGAQLSQSVLHTVHSLGNPKTAAR
ncbi:MAG: family 16 glycoside hydrolase [Planctomycetota bacterium]